MAKISRKKQKVFAGSATNNGQFGSAQAGTKVVSTDLDVLQNLAAFSTGWLDAVISGQKLPPLEEFQALDYINTTQLAYLFQEGMPEYEVGTTYFQYSIVKKAGTFQFYGSIVDNNTGNALTDNTKWKLLIDLSNSTGSTYVGTTASTDGLSYTITTTPAFTAMQPGQVVFATINTTNTGAMQLNPNGIGNVPVHDPSGAAIASGFVYAGYTYALLYNGSDFRVINPRLFIVSLASDANPDINADFVETWDVSASNYKKVLLSTLLGRAVGGYQPIASATQNWDSLLTPGSYAANGSTYTGTLPLGSGQNHDGTLLITGRVYTSANTISQMFSTYGNNRIFIRTTSDGGTTWTGWDNIGSNFRYIAQTGATLTLDNTAASHLYAYTGGSTATWTLPASATAGINFKFRAVNKSSSALTITRAGSDTIDGGTSIILYPGDIRDIYCTASGTFVSILIRGRITQLSLPIGSLVQRNYVQQSSLGTGTTQIPYDDTTPQITEGTEFLSLSITPTQANNIIRIRVNIPILGITGTGNNVATTALYNGATSAIAVAASFRSDNNDNLVPGVSLQYEFVPGSVSPITFSVRIGPSDATTVYVNGDSTGSRVFGGASHANMVVEEIQAV